MILVLDESVSAQIAEALRQGGHEVLCIWEMTPSIGDDEVLAVATQKGAVVITADKDFGELVYRQGRVSAGVLLLRLARMSQSSRGRVVLAAVEEHRASLKGAFTVLSPGLIRIRRGP